MLSNFQTRDFDKPQPCGAGRARRARAFGVAILRGALPQRCALCAASSGGALLCAACAGDMPRLGAACPQCALPTPAAERCGACIAASPSYDMTIAAWRYAYPADRLLRALKYGGRLALAEPLADALAEAVRLRGSPLPDRLLALPLAATRQRRRGFNHAQEIARRVSARVGVPLHAALRRTRDSPPQAGLDVAARGRNVRNAFEAVARLDGLAVAIVDDVMTTGATLASAAAAVRNAGALRVEAWVVARTLPPSQAGQPRAA